MCGIIGILSKSEPITPILLESITELQNRGYDSAGISVIERQQFQTYKYASTKRENAIEILKRNVNMNMDIESYIGIGHTRWATTGGKTDINSHPHMSWRGFFTLVHNGIIENYQELKQKLIEEENYRFVSQTDSEVICNYIESEFLKIFDETQSLEDDQQNIEKIIYKTLQKVLPLLTGTYGIVLLCHRDEQHIYCVKNGSPLLVGMNDDMIMVSSEQSGFGGRIRTYITLDTDDICILERKNGKLKIKTNIEYIERNCVIQNYETSPHPYAHWTLKEIYDQPISIMNALNHGGRIKNEREVKLGGLEREEDRLQRMEHIILLGMGTSYHSNLVGGSYMRKLCNFKTIQVIDGGEFHEDILSDSLDLEKVCIIFTSQSGETKDLHECLKICKKKNIFTLGVINVVDSLISREVDCGVYCNGGRERAVASTKIFTNQVIVLSLISIWFSQIQGVQERRREQMIHDVMSLSYHIESLLENSISTIQNIVEGFEYEHLFILGKGVLYPIACEASLKIKELSYIHSEAYSSSSLKHGPFALLDENFPVFILDQMDEHHSRNMNTLEEIECRDAPVYLFTNVKKSECPQNKNYHYIYVPNGGYYQPILMVVILQLFAYYLSLKRGCEIDMPRCLAKTVTTL